jgi:hypothetical protein
VITVMIGVAAGARGHDRQVRYSHRTVRLASGELSRINAGQQAGDLRGRPYSATLRIGGIW